MPEAQASRWEPILSIGVGLVSCAAPLAVGGVHPPVQLALSAAALLLLLALGATRGARGLRIPPFAGVALVAALWTLIQLVPLPAPLVRWLSPNAFALRAEVQPGAWLLPLTVDVPATWLALARLVACTALLVTAAGLTRSRGQARRILAFIAGVGALIAVVAFVQRALHIDKIFGVYQPRSTPGFGVFGTFVDVNHAAALFSLAALIAAGMAFELRGGARALAASVAVLTSAALLVSTSRSGALGLLVGGFLLALFLAARRIGVLRAIGVASLLMLLATATAVWSNEALRDRVWGHEQLFANQKTRGWADGVRLAEDYKWTGVGRGAFEAPVNARRQDDESVRLVYPENVVVQLTSEWGIPATLLLAILLFGTIRRILPTLAEEATPAVLGAASGVAAALVHDLGDFSLELPGVAFPAAVALGVVAGYIAAMERRNGQRRLRLQAGAWVPFWAAASLVLLAALKTSAHTLDADYAMASVAAQKNTIDGDALRAAIRRHPADDYLELVAARAALRDDPTTAMHDLNRALRLHPTNWQAHRLAARLLLASGHPAQAALEYRLALASGMVLDLNELTRLLAGHVVEAVPQTPARLTELARALYASGHVSEADAAARRAVDLSEERTPMLMTRVQLALQANATAILAAAARDLLREADSPDAYASAARALAAAGARSDGYAAIDSGLKAFPQNTALLLAGAELRIGGGDLAGARAALGRIGHSSLTLADRQRAEELLAEIEEKAGDPESAALARARARLIAKKRHDMTFSGE